MTISPLMLLEDPCLAADESWKAFRRSPASVRERGMVGYSFPALMPFSPSFVCQKKSNACSQVERLSRWLYRTPWFHIKEDHILNHLPVSKRVVVLKNLHFLLRKKEVISKYKHAEKLQTPWESLVSREGKYKTRCFTEYPTSGLLFFCLNILRKYSVSYADISFLHNNKDWTPADSTPHP